MKTLVVAPNWIGDALMAQPLLARLRVTGADPLDIIAPAALEALFRAMPEVDNVIATQLVHGRFQWRERRSLAQILRSLNYGAAYILPNSFKSALIPWLASIPQRTGYVGEWRGVLLTRALRNPDRTVPMAERYARLGPGPVAQLPVPRLSVPDERVDATLARFALTRAHPLYALCPGAEYGPAKRWPARHFAALADALHATEPGAQLLLLGAASDSPIAAEIAALAHAPLTDLCGRTTLADALGLIAAASGVVSNDSGLMHVAAALSRAQVAVFGSTDPRHTPPISARAQVVWLHLECSPCFARVCPLGHLRCLNDVAPETVLEALYRSQSDRTV